VINSTRSTAAADDVPLQTQLQAIETVSRLFDAFSGSASAVHFAQQQHNIMFMNMQNHAYLAEIAVLKHNLSIAEAKVAIIDQSPPQIKEVEPPETGKIVVPPETGKIVVPPESEKIVAPPETGKIVGRSSLSTLALPLNELQFRTVFNLPSVPPFDTPRVGAWDWVTTAEGELVITRVITTLLRKYSGSATCDASSLFLDIGANSG
jgi:hypothetical protein